MSAKLIWITPDAEKLIAYCARVSSNNQDNPKIEGLLNFCWKHGHYSIFEMASMCIEVVCSRAISSQILRHSFRVQEWSQRYAKYSSELDNIDLRSQHPTNRQLSIDNIEKDKKEKLQSKVEELNKSILDLYNDLLNEGVSKESARLILPMNSKTKMYLSGNIRDWIFYIKTRTKEDTQKEHRDLALQIKEIFFKEFPIIGKMI